MSEIGSFRSAIRDGVTRRSFLQAAASVPVALGLPRVAGSPGSTAANAEKEPRARSVLLVWLQGGPSHLDTFDPKPDAPSEIRGPFATIPTRSSGARFSELVPRLAGMSDRFAVVRSTRFAESHDMMPLAGGRKRGPGLPPNLGSIVARHRSLSGMPSFISVAPITAPTHSFESIAVPGYGAGTLGPAYDPLIVTCSAGGEIDIAGRKPVDDRKAGQRNREIEAAHALLNSEGLEAFDLSAESKRTRVSYGRTSFGQSLLLGRRLVEAGVPYTQVNWSLGVDGLEEGSNMGWDTHRNGFGQLLNYHGPIFDRAFSALIGELSDRGLLKSTLVVAMGEMGRTPKINKTGGRDHWATCSTLWAGAGVCGGRIVGETDEKGAETVTTPISALMVGTTIADLAGVDATSRAEMGVLDGGQVIRELF